jgi:hypothetical protein
MPIESGPEVRVTGEYGQDSHYRTIWDRLDRSQIIPFLGAGASVVEASTVATSSLPTGRQLARRLATRLNLPEDEVDCEDLIEVASCLALCVDRLYLEDELKAIFTPVRRFGPLHQFLARLMPAPRLIVTTNYDALVEEAFRSTNRPFHLVMSPVSERSRSALM